MLVSVAGCGCGSEDFGGEDEGQQEKEVDAEKGRGEEIAVFGDLHPLQFFALLSGRRS